VAVAVGVGDPVDRAADGGVAVVAVGAVRDEALRRGAAPLDGVRVAEAVAVGVAVPFAVAVQMGITFLFSVMSGVMARADRMAANADTNGIERINYLAMLALGIFYFLCAFLPIYFGAEHAKTAIDMLPARLIDGLGVAGGIMPAIGFAVLLKIMMKNVYIPYFIIGFVGAAWLKLPVLAIAAAALALALMDLMRKDPTPPQPARVQKEEFEDGI